MPNENQPNQTQVESPSITDEPSAELMAKWSEEAEAEYRALTEYSGDSYLVESSMADGSSQKDAEAEVQDLDFLRNLVELGGLPYVLKDRFASRALANAILDGHVGVLLGLATWATEVRPRRKTGRKADPKTGKYKKDVAVELANQGLTSGQIALRLFGDEKRGSNVTALLSQARKRQVSRVAAQSTSPTEPKRGPQ